MREGLAYGKQQLKLSGQATRLRALFSTVIDIVAKWEQRKEKVTVEFKAKRG